MSAPISRPGDPRSRPTTCMSEGRGQSGDQFPNVKKVVTLRIQTKQGPTPVKSWGNTDSTAPATGTKSRGVRCAGAFLVRRHQWAAAPLGRTRVKSKNERAHKGWGQRPWGRAATHRGWGGWVGCRPRCSELQLPSLGKPTATCLLDGGFKIKAPK